MNHLRKHCYDFSLSLFDDGDDDGDDCDDDGDDDEDSVCANIVI